MRNVHLRWIKRGLLFLICILLLFFNTYLSTPVEVSSEETFGALSLATKPEAKPKLHVLIYASGPGPNINFCKVLKLALVKKLRISLIGWREKWHGLISKWEKLGSILDELHDEDVVLFTDAYDVLHTGTEDELMEAYEKWDSSKIHFNCEQECWPFRSLHNKTYGSHICEDLYKMPPVNEGDEFDCRYLNTGIWMGKVKIARRLVSDMHEIISDQKYKEYLRNRNLKWDISAKKLDDQYLVSTFYGLDQKDYLAVDHMAQLFVTYADGWKIRHDIKCRDDGIVSNYKTKTKPKIIHFNSITPKVEFMPIFEEKIISALDAHQISPHTKVLVNGNWSEYQNLCYQFPELYDENHTPTLQARANEMRIIVVMVRWPGKFRDYWCSQFFTMNKDANVHVVDIEENGSTLEHFKWLLQFLDSLVNTLVLYLASPIGYLTLDLQRIKMKYLQLSVQYNGTRVWFAGQRICTWENIWKDIDMRRYCFRKYPDCFTSKCYVRYFNATMWVGEASHASQVFGRFLQLYEQREEWFQNVHKLGILPKEVLSDHRDDMPLSYFFDLVYSVERDSLPMIVDEHCDFFQVVGEGVNHLRLDNLGIRNQYLGSRAHMFWHSDPAPLAIVEDEMENRRNKLLQEYKRQLNHAKKQHSKSTQHHLFDEYCPDFDVS